MTLTTTSIRIKQALELTGMSQKELAEKSGINTSALSSYINGRYQPKQDAVYKLAQALGVSESWLLGFEVPMTKENATSDGVSIPILGTVKGGFPINMVENVIGLEEISKKLSSTGEFFCLRVSGDSMAPNICDGDLVIVRKQSDAESGDTVIVAVNSDEATCKRIHKTPDGITLLPNNPTFSPIFYTNEEIESLPVAIFGKVMELRRTKI